MDFKFQIHDEIIQMESMNDNQKSVIFEKIAVSMTSIFVNVTLSFAVFIMLAFLCGAYSCPASNHG